MRAALGFTSLVPLAAEASAAADIAVPPADVAAWTLRAMAARIRAPGSLVISVSRGWVAVANGTADFLLGLSPFKNRLPHSGPNSTRWPIEAKKDPPTKRTTGRRTAFCFATACAAPWWGGAF